MCIALFRIYLTVLPSGAICFSPRRLPWPFRRGSIKRPESRATGELAVKTGRSRGKGSAGKGFLPRLDSLLLPGNFAAFLAVLDRVVLSNFVKEDFLFVFGLINDQIESSSPGDLFLLFRLRSVGFCGLIHPPPLFLFRHKLKAAHFRVLFCLMIFVNLEPRG